jgi:hypothetical protein
MLCDDFSETLLKGMLRVPAVVEKIVDLRSAQRFVLSPQVVQTVDGLHDASKIESMRKDLFTPAEITWLEWRGGNAGSNQSSRHGILLVGADVAPRRSIVTGTGYYICDDPGMPGELPAAVPIIWDFPEGPSLQLVLGDGIWRVLDQYTSLRNLDVHALGAWIITALAIINTPRLANVRFEDRTKLNRSREKSGKPPVLSWSEVSIKVDAGTPGHGDQRARATGRALHHVRSFFRLRRGQVEIVRPHWRGNPDIGVKRHRYTVSKSGDKGGEWKGGPLPPSQIIKTTP